MIAVIDYNKIQSLAPVEDTLALEPFADKWGAFGWAVKQVDGHNHQALADTFAHFPVQRGMPTVVIAPVDRVVDGVIVPRKFCEKSYLQTSLVLTLPTQTSLPTVVIPPTPGYAR